MSYFRNPYRELSDLRFMRKDHRFEGGGPLKKKKDPDTPEIEYYTDKSGLRFQCVRDASGQLWYWRPGLQEHIRLQNYNRRMAPIWAKRRAEMDRIMRQQEEEWKRQQEEDAWNEEYWRRRDEVRPLANTGEKLEQSKQNYLDKYGYITGLPDVRTQELN